jgi:hypothetical protein
MVSTTYELLVDIELPMTRDNGWAPPYVEKVKLGSAGITITVSTEQTTDKESQDDGVNITWDEDTETRHGFSTLGRLIASGALKQVS